MALKPMLVLGEKATHQIKDGKYGEEEKNKRNVGTWKQSLEDKPVWNRGNIFNFGGGGFFDLRLFQQKAD
ncbi:MAG TPA: hypothetical protein VMV05_00180 [bacterium]|nr:hypothetical protein [bacterium]